MRKKGLNETRTLTSAMPMQAWDDDKPGETGYIAISKNVVGENDECQLSNGECTTERKCGY